jgi:hypothetical protein
MYFLSIVGGATERDPNERMDQMTSLGTLGAGTRFRVAGRPLTGVVVQPSETAVRVRYDGEAKTYEFEAMVKGQIKKVKFVQSIPVVAIAPGTQVEVL